MSLDTILHILLVEDSPGDARLVRLMLNEASVGPLHLRYKCVEAANLHAALVALEESAFDVVLTDLSLPDSHGLDTVTRVLQAAPKTPVVVMSGLDDHEMALQAVQAGAQDYLVKGHVNEFSLPRAIQYAIERQRSGEAMRRAEAEYRTLATNSPDLIVRLDEQMRLLYLNPTAARVLRLDPAVEVGRSIGETAMSASMAAEWKRRIKSVFATGEMLVVEDTFNDDDVDRYFHTRLAPELTSDGTIGSVLSISRDFTEHRWAEMQLRLQSSALNAAANAIVITDAEGTIQWVNPAWTELTGYGSDEVIGRNPRFLRSGVQDRAFYEELWETICSGRVWRKELVNRRKDGSNYTEEETITPLLDTDGDVTHFIAVKQDISARKRVENERELLLAQVQSQAQQIASLMDTMPAGVLLVESGGDIVMANPAGQRDLAELAHAEVGGRLTSLAGVPLAVLLGAPPSGQRHELQINGRTLEVVARPIAGDPESDRWMLVIEDVTQAHAERDHLQQQERLAAVGQLAAGIAHDFNNILAIISLQAPLISRGSGLTERERERLDVISEQTAHASRLVQQLLDFSRRSVLERRTIDLVPILASQVKLLERTLPESIDVILQCDPGRHLIHADPLAYSRW